MGSKVKAAVGIAAVVFAPYIVAGLAGAGGVALSATAYYAAVGAVTLVGASVVGNALAPEPPDIEGVEAYAGTKLQNQKTNTASVPISYGENRLGGNIVWQGARGTSNNDLHQIIIVGEGDINSFVSFHIEKETLTAVGSNGVYHTSAGYVQVLGYTDKPSTINSPTDDAGAVDTLANLFPGANLDSLIPNNTSFIVVRQVYNSPNHTSPSVINAIIQGQKIKTITAADTISTSETYSNNPAEVVLDLMLNGLNIPQGEIDTSEFYNAKVKCNDYGFTCNITFNQQRNIQSCIKDVLATCRGQVVYSQGQWKLKLDEKQKTVAKALDEDDIINKSLNISMKGFNEIANQIGVKYVNPADEWLGATVTKEDSDLITNDGQAIEKTLDIKGVTSSAQADKLAEITLNIMRYTEDVSGNRIKQTPLAISFGTSVRNADLEVGDLISLDHTLLDRVRKFLILSVESDQSGAIQLSAREYCETHFKDSSGSYLI